MAYKAQDRNLHVLGRKLQKDWFKMNLCAVCEVSLSTKVLQVCCADKRGPNQGPGLHLKKLLGLKRPKLMFNCTKLRISD